MLAAYSWDGGGDGTNWSDAHNWNVGGGQPLFAPGLNAGQADDVSIAGTSSNVTLDIDVAVNPLNSFTLSNGALFSAAFRTFTVNGPSLISNGFVEWYQSTWADTGAGSLTNDGAFTARGFSNISTDSIAQNGTLNVYAQFNTTTLLTVGNGFVNEGDIFIDNASGRGGWPSHLVVSSGVLTNSATGVINVVDGEGGRSINADVINNGTVNIGDTTQFSKPNGVFTNNGDFNVTGSLSISGSNAVFNQNGGTFDVLGSFTTSGDTFNFNGASLSGNPPVLLDSALNIGAASTGAATFSFRGLNNTLNGDVAMGQRLQIDAVSNTTTVLTAAQGFTNDGTIVLDHISPNGNFSSNLVVTSGLLTNSATGVITAELGQGVRTINADVVNNGTININDTTQLLKPSGVFTNNADSNISTTGELSAPANGVVFNQDAGSLDVLGSFSLNNDTFNYNSGSLSGNSPVLFDSALNIGAGSTGAGEFLFRGLNNTLSGDVAASQTLRIEAVSNTTTVLTAALGFTNDGTIVLDHISPNGNFPAALTVLSGVLTNSATGIVTTELGQGIRIISADIVNNGTFNIDDDTQLSKANGVITNNADFSIAATGSVSLPGTAAVFNQGGGTLDLAGTLTTNDDTFSFTGGSITGGGAAAFTNSTVTGLGTAAIDVSMPGSTINIGASPGILNIEEDAGTSTGGNWTQAFGSDLNVDIGGPTPGAEHDQLNIANNGDLTGTLNIAFVNGFVPSPCDRFEIVTYGSRSGNIPNLNVTGLPAPLNARVDYNTNSATIVIYENGVPINVHPTSVSVAEGGATSSYEVCLGTSIAPTGLVTVTPTSGFGQVSMAPASLTFDPASNDWQQTKQLTVSAIDDASVEGDQSDIVSHNSTSSDSAFDSTVSGFSIPSVNANITDNDTATVAFDLATSTLNEDGPIQNLDVVLTIPGGGTLGQAITVTVADLLSGTASNNDYTTALNELTFPIGSGDGTIRSAELQTLIDAKVEGDEIVAFSLQDLAGPNTIALGAQQTHTATIDDDDFATVAFTAATSNVGEGAATHDVDVELIINSSPATGGTLDREISIDVVDLLNGSADTPDDYTFATQTVTFGIASTSGPQVVSLTIVDDADPEFDETIVVDLASLVDGSNGQASIAAPHDHTITIQDDDNASITVEDVSATEGGGLLFTVTLDSAVPAFDVSVSFADVDATGGTAPLAFPEDYDNASVTLNFAGNAGEQQQFTVATTNDVVVENDETFIVNLSTMSVLVNDAHTATGTITDNDDAGGNEPPVITTLVSSSPGCGGALHGEAVSITAKFTDPNLADTHTATIDWGDGTVTTGLANPSTSTATGSHTYDDGGIYTITVTVDDGTDSESETTAAFVAGVRLTDDGVLQIIGTDGKDRVAVKWVGGSGGGHHHGRGKGKDGADRIRAITKLNVRGSKGGEDISYYNPDEVQSALIILCDGNDRAVIGTGVSDGANRGRHDLSIPAHIDGGAGNDRLTGGQGSDTLLGGPGKDKLRGRGGDDTLLGNDGRDNLSGGWGNDVLVGGDDKDKLNGGRGRDVLIGGLGRDDLRGGSGGDLLIAGWTTYDNNLSALELIMQAWGASNSYNRRLNNLRNGTGSILSGTGVKLVASGPDQTVFDDNVRDKLRGDRGRDWFFADLDEKDNDDDWLRDRRNEALELL